MAASDTAGPAFGANSWLVEEMFEQYRADPDSVGDAWREFFEDYRSVSAPAHTSAAPATPPDELPAPTLADHEAAPSTPSRPSTPAAPSTPATSGASTPAQASPPTSSTTPRSTPATTEDAGEPIKGVGAVIVKNMAASLDVPTATSFRNVPAKLLEVNRKVINGYRARSGMGKVSFTHLIGYAMVKAIAEAVPNMKNGFVEGADGKPRIVRHEHVNMGLAVDIDKGDGSARWSCPWSRTPTRSTSTVSSRPTRRSSARSSNNKLTIDDFAGANITLTNPGTIGTVQSVPRLMPGQGVIVGVGNIAFPAEFEGADVRNLSSLGVSKVVTITSTYDHRIIQGAESGMFLKRVHELLLGEHGFYDDIFHDLDMPYEAVKWRPDINPIDREEAMLAKQMAVAKLIRVHRVRGHLIADLDPLHWKEPHMPVELDPATYGLTIWDLDREFLTDGVGGQDKMTLGNLLGVLRDAYCRTIGVEYMHIQSTDEQRWIQERRRGQATCAHQGARRTASSSGSTPPRRSRSSSPPSTSARSGSGSRAPSRRSRSSTRSSSGAADDGLDGAVLGMAHRGRLNVLSNIMGKSYEAIFSEFEGHVDPNTVQGSGDVKYHLGATGKYESPSGCRHQGRARRQPEPSRDGRPDRDGHCPRATGPDRSARLRSRCCRC